MEQIPSELTSSSKQEAFKFNNQREEQISPEDVLQMDFQEIQAVRNENERNNLIPTTRLSHEKYDQNFESIIDQNDFCEDFEDRSGLLRDKKDQNDDYCKDKYEQETSKSRQNENQVTIVQESNQFQNQLYHQLNQDNQDPQNIASPQNNQYSPYAPPQSLSSDSSKNLSFQNSLPLYQDPEIHQLRISKEKHHQQQQQSTNSLQDQLSQPQKKQQQNSEALFRLQQRSKTQRQLLPQKQKSDLGYESVQVEEISEKGEVLSTFKAVVSRKKTERNLLQDQNRIEIENNYSDEAELAAAAFEEEQIYEDAIKRACSAEQDIESNVLLTLADPDGRAPNKPPPIFPNEENPISEVIEEDEEVSEVDSSQFSSLKLQKEKKKWLFFGQNKTEIFENKDGVGSQSKTGFVQPNGISPNNRYEVNQVSEQGHSRIIEDKITHQDMDKSGIPKSHSLISNDLSDGISEERDDVPLDLIEETSSFAVAKSITEVIQNSKNQLSILIDQPNDVQNFQQWSPTEIICDIDSCKDLRISKTDKFVNETKQRIRVSKKNQVQSVVDQQRISMQSKKSEAQSGMTRLVIDLSSQFSEKNKDSPSSHLENKAQSKDYCAAVIEHYSSTNKTQNDDNMTNQHTPVTLKSKKSEKSDPNNLNSSDYCSPIKKADSTAEDRNNYDQSDELDDKFADLDLIRRQRRAVEFQQELAMELNDGLPFEQRVSELNPAQLLVVENNGIKPDGQPIFLNGSTIEFHHKKNQRSLLLETNRISQEKQDLIVVRQVSGNEFVPDTTTPVQVAGFNGTFESEDKMQRIDCEKSIEIQDGQKCSQFKSEILEDKQIQMEDSKSQRAFEFCDIEIPNNMTQNEPIFELLDQQMPKIRQQVLDLVSIARTFDKIGDQDQELSPIKITEENDQLQEQEAEKVPMVDCDSKEHQSLKKLYNLVESLHRAQLRSLKITNQ